MTGLTELFFAVLGPTVALLLARLTAGSDTTFISRGVARVAADQQLCDRCRVAMEKAAYSTVAAVTLFPSLVAGVTSIYGTTFGLLQGHAQEQVVMLFAAVLLVLLLAARPLWYLMTHSLYDLHNHELPSRRRASAPPSPPATYLERVRQVPTRVNIVLITLAIAAFGWRNAGASIGASLSNLRRSLCGC